MHGGSEGTHCIRDAADHCVAFAGVSLDAWTDTLHKDMAMRVGGGFRALTHNSGAHTDVVQEIEIEMKIVIDREIKLLRALAEGSRFAI